MALPRQAAGLSAASVLVLLAFGHLAPTEAPDPVQPSPLPGTASPPAQVPPDQVWSNLLAKHYSYAQAIERVVPVPEPPPPPPEPERSLHFFGDAGFEMVRTYGDSNHAFDFVSVAATRGIPA